MPPPVPQGFPDKLTDEELDAALSGLRATVDAWPSPVLPELTLALMKAGFDERAQRANDRLLRWTLAATAVGVIVAVVALVVSLLS